jgi:hypothetical protein
VILLNRGSRASRIALFQELKDEGFDYVISLEGNQKRYDIEELSGSFPFVRFILLREEINPGLAINLAAGELSSPLFFVLWSDLRIIRGGGAERIAERLLLGAEELVKKPEQGRYKRLCTVPVIQNARVEVLPTLSAPALSRSRVRTVPFTMDQEGAPSLYPYEGIGLYDRERFIRLGGFDGAIGSFYWQLMDFGFRAHLWGEEISATSHVKLSYNGLTPVIDNTADENYRRFYLKNLAPRYRRDHAAMPLSHFLRYCLRSGGDFFSAWKEFSAVRSWVRTNRYRFRSDISGITRRWDGIEETGGETAMAGRP